MEYTTKYSKEQLEQKHIRELESYYVEAYKANRQGSDSQLELITEILFNRDDIEEKLLIRKIIAKQLRISVEKENYEAAARLRDMLKHYERHILG